MRVLYSSSFCASPGGTLVLVAGSTSRPGSTRVFPNTSTDAMCGSCATVLSASCQ